MNVEKTLIEQKVLNAAKPYLKNKVVKDLVIGLSMVGCQLSDGHIGLSYVLRYDLPQGCSVFDYTQSIIGMPALQVANWALSGKDILQRSIGAAVLVAASRNLPIGDDNEDSLFGLDIKADDVVGMIGYIKPIAGMLSKKVKELIVFDEGVEKSEDNKAICKVEVQPVLLPRCNKMIITGSSTINGTIDNLLSMCENAEQIALVGSSTPMFKEAFEDTKVVSLAGSWWEEKDKEKIFKIISLAGGIAQLKPYMIKKIALV